MKASDAIGSGATSSATQLEPHGIAAEVTSASEKGQVKDTLRSSNLVGVAQLGEPVCGSPPHPTGLSEAEARSRLAMLRDDWSEPASGRTYGQILRANALMSVNVIIFAIGSALTAMGLYIDAMITVGLVALNIMIAVLQEGKAKRTLDQIALLSRPLATVVRGGNEREIDPGGIVPGDLVIARQGDQILADGRIVGDGHAEVDESLLTGEDDPVEKTIGDQLSSGSFVVAGQVAYEAEHVGRMSYASRLTAKARTFQVIKTPVQREIDRVLRWMVVLILVIGGPVVLDLVIRLLGLAFRPINSSLSAMIERAYQGYSVQDSVRATAVIVGLIPQGLVLMLTVAYAMGAVRLARRNALLQQANAVESLSHVDVLCLDKTGTLTTNSLVLHSIHPIALHPDVFRVALGDFACNTSDVNRTLQAIASAVPGKSRPVRARVPFSSARKWSALLFADEDAQTWFVLGAPEILAPSLLTVGDWERTGEVLTAQGLRVLMLARLNGMNLEAEDDAGHLPLASLEPLGLVSLRDELQPDVAATIESLLASGITIKIISGDHPQTVSNLARQAGVPDDLAIHTLSGLDLASLDESQRRAIVEQTTIFGRIAPEQKLTIIRALQESGHYVAMIGDGVNDVLALKQAEVGIAMASGSQASRAVADMVLLANTFATIPDAIREGQRIVQGTQDLLKLFLARSLSVACTILGAGIVGAAFPVMPTQGALPALLTVGIPTVALVAWARPAVVRTDPLVAVLEFALPAALAIGAVESAIYIAYLRITGDVELARSVHATVAVACGLLLIMFLNRSNSGDHESNWQPAALAISLLAAYVGLLSLPGTRSIFELANLSWTDVGAISLAVSVWIAGFATILKFDLFKRWLTTTGYPGQGSENVHRIR